MVGIQTMSFNFINCSINNTCSDKMQIEIALKNVHFKHVDFPIYNKLLCKQDIISIKIYILLNTWKNTCIIVDCCGI